MFCLVNSITQSWMLEHWEGGPGSQAAERVWVSFFGKCKPKEGCQVQLLLSTLPALPTLAQKETGFTQTSHRLSQGWPAYSPISQCMSKTCICHINYSRHTHEWSAEMDTLLSRKWKGVRRCLHTGKYRKRPAPLYINSFKWLTVKPKIHYGAGPTAQQYNVTNPEGTPAAINSQSQQQWPHPLHHFHYGW